jgi:HEAT repeat protein
MKRIFNKVAVWLTVCLCAAGCGRADPPLTAGGHPVSHWLEEVKKPDPKARKKAVRELGHVGTADPAAVPAVVAALRDKDAAVRKEATVAVLNLGPVARDAEPALTEMARADPDSSVREYAKKALDRVKGTTP